MANKQIQFGLGRQQIAVSVLGEVVAIYLRVGGNYEAQAICDDLTNQLNMGKPLTIDIGQDGAS